MTRRYLHIDYRGQRMVFDITNDVRSDRRITQEAAKGLDIYVKEGYEPTVVLETPEEFAMFDDLKRRVDEEMVRRGMRESN